MYKDTILGKDKEEEQLEDRRSIGASSCNCGDGTDQRVQSLIFMMMMMIMEPPSSMRSVVDRNIVMRRMTRLSDF